VLLGLRGDSLLLNARQKLLRFGQRLTQMGNIARPSGRLTSTTSEPRD
jgi:hypothetical protein